MRCVGDETARCLSSVNICAATCFETNHRVADIEHGFGLRVWFPIIFSTQTPLLSTRPFHFRHKSRYVRLDCFIFDTKAVTFDSTVAFFDPTVTFSTCPLRFRLVRYFRPVRYSGRIGACGGGGTSGRPGHRSHGRGINSII